MASPASTTSRPVYHPVFVTAIVSSPLDDTIMLSTWHRARDHAISHTMMQREHLPYLLATPSSCTLRVGCGRAARPSVKSCHAIITVETNANLSHEIFSRTSTILVKCRSQPRCSAMVAPSPQLGHVVGHIPHYCNFSL